MLISILCISLSFLWLCYETKWFTIRLAQCNVMPLNLVNSGDIPETRQDTIQGENTMPEPQKSHEILLLPEQCELTRLQNENKNTKYRDSWRYGTSYNHNYTDSFQTMLMGNHTITLRVESPELYDRLSEVDKALNSKPNSLAIKMGQLKFPSLYKLEYDGFENRHNPKTVLRDDLLVSSEWIKAHEHDEYPEPTIDIIVNDKTFHVNGNYKKGLIKEYMSAYITKARIGRKVVNLNVGIADKV